jgi:putative NIF3 family GTP cyclohydrolase 1 type 2
LTGRSYAERTVIKAIRNDIAIYAIHTNLDNVSGGVNAVIASRLGLENTQVLEPLTGKLKMLVTYAPGDVAGEIRNQLFKAGAGHISDYDECSFSVPGTGTFRPLPGSDPATGNILERHSGTEERIEVIYEEWKEKAILRNLFRSHPYEEVAYNIYRLENSHRLHGAGIIGELSEPLKTGDFLELLKSRMQTPCVRHTSWEKPVRKVAVCGGSGSFLLNRAIREGADVFVSADFKYHQFFDADGKILIADIGHFESEQFTINLLGDYLTEKFTNFAVRLTELSTNPINYF